MLKSPAVPHAPKYSQGATAACFEQTSTPLRQGHCTGTGHTVRRQSRHSEYPRQLCSKTRHVPPNKGSNLEPQAPPTHGAATPRPRSRASRRFVYGSGLARQKLLRCIREGYHHAPSAEARLTHRRLPSSCRETAMWFCDRSVPNSIVGRMRMPVDRCRIRQRDILIVETRKRPLPSYCMCGSRRVLCPGPTPSDSPSLPPCGRSRFVFLHSMHRASLPQSNTNTLVLRGQGRWTRSITAPFVPNRHSDLPAAHLQLTGRANQCATAAFPSTGNTIFGCRWLQLILVVDSLQASERQISPPLTTPEWQPPDDTPPGLAFPASSTGKSRQRRLPLNQPSKLAS